MSENWKTRLSAAWRALTGNMHEDLRNRVAELELDLRQKEVEIGALREEYQLLRQHGELERTNAANAGLDALARRVAPPLSQLVTMCAMAGSERVPRLEDVFKLSGKLEQALTEEGLMRIGSVGEQTTFDTSKHQCMSGADIDEDDLVRVRFVGYRLQDAVLLKAMVSRAKTDGAGESP